MEAMFLLGLCRYNLGDFDAAATQFRIVAAEMPLNEVYNNLGAALSRKGDSAALENFERALEGDQADPDFWFNVGYALWKRGRFQDAVARFRAVLDRAGNDQEATSFLGRSLKGETPRAGDTRTENRERVKTSFEDSAFRQLQAEMRRK
jgi:Flp pilus assembly protein TadD